MFRPENLPISSVARMLGVCSRTIRRAQERDMLPPGGRLALRDVRAAPLLRPQQVATRAGVQPDTVRKWISRGKLNATFVGGCNRVSLVDVERLIRSRGHG